MPRDVLEEILSAAAREKAIAGESIASFAEGLRDRARLVLEERLRPVQERVLALEKENEWRARDVESLTVENERAKDEIRRLKDDNQRTKDEHGRVSDENRRLKDENVRVKDDNGRLKDESRRLKEEIEGVRAEWRTASAAHDRLLDHHRAVLRGAADTVAAVTALALWKRGQARARLADLEAVLRKDTA